MSHLTPDQYVDLMEGTIAETDVPHLSVCTACREQLSELRATFALAADVDVPEPSPWFWEQLSARVREAVAAERRGIASWLRPWTWHVAALGTVAAVLLLAAVIALNTSATRPIGTDAADPSPVDSVVAAASAVDDDSFAFVADLAVGLDWESASDAGLGPRRGVEQVVADLSDSERAELQRLLTEALDGLG